MAPPQVKDGKMHFRLYMTQVSDQPPAASGGNGGDTAPQQQQQQPGAPPALPVVRTIDFVFDPEVDTAEALAAEIRD